MLTLPGHTIFHFAERDKGPRCLLSQLCTQATVTPVTLLTLRLVLQEAGGRGQEAVAELRSSYQIIFSGRATGVKSPLDTRYVLTCCPGWSEERGNGGGFPSTRILVNENRKQNVFILSPATLFTANNARDKVREIAVPCKLLLPAAFRMA